MLSFCVVEYSIQEWEFKCELLSKITVVLDAILCVCILTLNLIEICY